MKLMTKQNRYAALELLIVAVCVTLASRAVAEEKVVKPQDVPATVIAHLPLPQASGSQMLLQRENAKLYLYVQQAAKQGFMVVDVTRPEKPSLLKRTAESNQATSGNLEMVSPNVAIAEAPEKTPGTLTSSNHPTETVRVLDLSDPRNPKTLETFNKVTSILPDSTHSLIYLTNNEGLWILRYNHPSLLEPAKKKPPCDSNSEIMAMPPDCD
jgi:methionine-rich copper-binding protein CopC